MTKQKFRKKPVVIEAYQTDKELEIETLEGTMHASIGDWIITGVKGEPYPCKPDVFEKTYEPAVEVKEAMATTIEQESSCRNTRQVDLKRGNWIDRASELDADFGRHDYVCSKCFKRANYFVGGSEDWWDTQEPNYCPNCGARMESNEE